MDSIEVRQQQLENLNQFIESSKVQMKFLLESFNWSEENTKMENTITCPNNSGHLIPIKSVNNHTQKCSLKKLGYSLDDKFLSEPSNYSDATVYIDKAKKMEILGTEKGCNKADPKTQERLQTTYTTEERLALYDYSVKSTKGPPELPEFNPLDLIEANKELTYEERLEQERNAKRRRIKYKAVHTSRKNHTEVIRDVITNQMNAYQDFLVEKESVGKKHDVRNYKYDSHKSSRYDKNYKRRSREKQESTKLFKYNKSSESNVMYKKFNK